ncbi:MAG: hypothetical protein ABIG69_07700 [Bacteroidota bacterium]
MVKRNKMVKNVFMIILVVGLLVVCGEGVFAQPSISSVSGSVSDGGSVSISGFGFGVMELIFILHVMGMDSELILLTA